jgi:ribosomal protein L37AE/L43A
VARLGPRRQEAAIMNTPTICMVCEKVFPIDQMARDSGGNWYCRTCRRSQLELTIEQLKQRGAWLDLSEPEGREPIAEGDYRYYEPK